MKIKHLAILIAIIIFPLISAKNVIAEDSTANQTTEQQDQSDPSNGLDVDATVQLDQSDTFFQPSASGQFTQTTPVNTSASGLTATPNEQQGIMSTSSSLESDPQDFQFNASTQTITKYIGAGDYVSTQLSQLTNREQYEI